MTEKETIQVLQSIEDRAVDFPYMTACDWVAIAAAKRHLENSLKVKEVEEQSNDLEEEIELVKGDYEQVDVAWNNDFDFIARHFYELGLKEQLKDK